MNRRGPKCVNNVRDGDSRSGQPDVSPGAANRTPATSDQLSAISRPRSPERSGPRRSAYGRFYFGLESHDSY